MRILALCSDVGIPILGNKGASVHVRSMAAALAGAGHSVIVAGTNFEPAAGREPAALAGRPLRVDPSALVTGVHLALKEFNAAVGHANSLPNAVRRILLNEEVRRAVAQHLREAPPDAVYERASLYGTAGLQLARAFDRPLVLELNAPLAAEQAMYRSAGLDDLAGQAERLVVSQADAVLAVSSALRAHAIALGAPPSRVHVLPNGVDPTLFRPGLRDPGVRKRWRLGDGPVLGFVSGLRPWHGVDDLMPLLAALAPRHPDLRLVVAGDGPARERLVREAASRGLADAVVFTGWVPHEELAPLVRHFDVGLAPYGVPPHAFYFSPLKLFEYMACGVPVVAPALGQIAEIVRDGVTGLLYPPGDVAALAAACHALLRDPARRARVGGAAAAEIHARYTWDHNAAALIRLVESLRRVSVR